MKIRPQITPVLLFSFLCACSVRSRAPESQGINGLFGEAGAPSDTEAPATDAGSNDQTDAAPFDPAAFDAAALADAEPAADGSAPGSDAAVADTGEQQDAGPVPAGPNLPRARGFYVFGVDYNNSVNIAAVSVAGKVLSSSLLSSGSELPGLSLPLGTDSVPVTQVQSGDELVVLDRTNHAIDWLALSAQVTNQIGVGPGGFAANPYDYLELSPELGFVSRFATNGAPGNADLDEGGDLLAIDPSSGELLGRVDFNHLTEGEADLEPRPTKIIDYDGNLYVVLGMLAADFTPVTESVLAKVDPNTLEVTATLSLGLRNCEDISMAPRGSLAAIACKGGWADDPITVNSGIVIVDLASAAPQIAATYGAAELAEAQISTLSFASETQILFSAYGSTYPTVIDDAAFTLDLTDGSVSDPVMEAGAYQLGQIRCAAEQNVCVIANADTFAVEFFEVDEDGVSHSQTVEIDDNLGLPPRYIGVF